MLLRYPSLLAATLAVVLTGAQSRCALAQSNVGDQIFVEAGSSEEVAGFQEQPPDDYGALLQRLERAEAEIQSLKEAPGSFDNSFPAAPTEGYGSSFKDLEDRFESFRAGLAEKTYPFVELHGAVQTDWGWNGQDQRSIDEFGILKDGADFRRTRLSANGAIAPNVNYFVQMDFAFPGRPTFTDVWVEITKLPLVGNIRIGQWKQPFSLEVVSSFRYTMMPERSTLFQAFTPFRHIAVGMYDWSENERMTWAASLYRPGQDQFGDSIASRGGYAGVARVTGLPWWECEGSKYLHLGAAYNYVAPNGRFGGFRSIPEFFIGQHDSAANGSAGTATPTIINGTPFFVNTGNFFMNHYNLVGTEVLWVNGPWTVQSEFMYLSALRDTGQLANFAGFYTQMGYFLTGEHRPYITRAGAIDRIKVLDDFGPGDDGFGWGGWELATRFSYIDLNSHDIRGGRLFNYTACLNWYLNSYTKVQAEYIRADLTNAQFGQSLTNLYDLRMQWDF